ncbi:hypothetical protein B0H11DRAFT_2222756 [Mycena galericulata]|nr:hypothetical protein B0H11DRAFT_2222756 [Mycena galericulata]
MQTPTELYDKTVLEGDPFASTFFAQNNAGLPRSRENGFFNHLVGEVHRVPGGIYAVKKWLSFALSPKMAYPVNQQNTKFFVHFFWLLYRERGNIEAAEALLNKERRSRGFAIDTVPPRRRPSQQDLAMPMSTSVWYARTTDAASEPPRKVPRWGGPLSSIPPSFGPPNNPPTQPGASGFKFSVTMPSHSDEQSEAVRTRMRKTPRPASGSDSIIEDQDVVPEVENAYTSPTSLARSYSYGWPSSHGGFPPVWAKSRQEMCETVPYFRSYQGGVYQKDSVAKGYLLSSFGAARDCFEQGGKFIISHGGGGQPQDPKRQKHLEAVDQTEAKASVQALLKNYMEATPVLLLVDDKYTRFPLNLEDKGIYIAVLGFYMVIDAWAELEDVRGDKVVRWKFAFQWCSGQGEPWWHAPQTETEFPGFGESTARYRCGTCRNDFPQVYAEGWFCGNTNCPFFWKMSKGLLPETLNFSSSFTSLRHPPPQLPAGFDARFVREIDELVPEPDPESVGGWHCKNCGRVSSRCAWDRYECPNCHATQSIDHQTRTALSLVDNGLIPPQYDSRDFILHNEFGIVTSPIKPYNTGAGFGLCQSFNLPENRGKIHHIRANAPLNMDADRIFDDYQKQAADSTLSFRRCPLQKHFTRGEHLSSYFSQNTGAEYRYISGSSKTVPFDEAPSAVIDAHRLICNRVEAALQKNINFNEVLSVAYLDKNQKMAYHSDDEMGLGPVVAGAPALMHFRPVAKPTAGRQHGRVLSILLQHGSILVMEGSEVQEDYQHTVPLGFRIAATARHIDPARTKTCKGVVY